MRVHARESEVLVRYLKCSEFTLGWAKSLLVHHSVSGHSECLADEGRIPLGASVAFIVCLCRPMIGLYVSSILVDKS